MNRLFLLWCLAMPCSLASAAATLTRDDIGASARIPSAGRPVTYTVRLRAPADRSLAGDFRVSLEVAEHPVAEKAVHLELAAAEHQDVTLQWTPQADGWYRLTFRAIGPDSTTPRAQVEQDVPVTHRPFMFLWFGSPQHFKWCNVPTTVKPEDRDGWLWRGALPCAWKGGVCYKEWSVEQYTKSYNDSPWIAIDEIGSYDETDRKIIAAVRAHKQAHPTGCRALVVHGCTRLLAGGARRRRPVRTRDLLTLTGSRYVAILDLAKDQIRSLKVRTDGPELLGSPWVFSSTGYTGAQPAQVKELPGGLLVTIPFTNPQAEGFSRYSCYAAAPVIRIERFFQPRAEMKVTAFAEGCRMPQRGGVYALQPGVGGPVRRGTLRDSSDYSDLLCGYLGSGPGPDNARLAGWFDCAFTRDGGGGMGVVIERRWEAAHSDVGYDVTRYYDGGDWLSVLNLWGKELSVSTPQTQIVYLLPHGPLALDQAAVVGPAQRLWNHLQMRAPAALVAP